MNTTKTRAFATQSATSPLAAATIPRREPTPHDVQIEILFCGICHSDLHFARNEWSSLVQTVYPCVPGHEIVGRVTKVGSAVTQFQPGDLAAVGCLVDADRSCPHCRAGYEQFCPGQVWTYGGADKHLGLPTYGGYSESHRTRRYRLRPGRSLGSVHKRRTRRRSARPGPRPRAETA